MILLPAATLARDLVLAFAAGAASVVVALAGAVWLLFTFFSDYDDHPALEDEDPSGHG